MEFITDYKNCITVYYVDLHSVILKYSYFNSKTDSLEQFAKAYTRYEIIIILIICNGCMVITKTSNDF